MARRLAEAKRGLRRARRGRRPERLPDGEQRHVVGRAPVANTSKAVGPVWEPLAPPGAGRGLFELALRAASLAWHPDPTVAPSPVTDPTMAMPVVLAAWRATERELAGMTGDSPEQEYLEANAMMLQAIYQRLYRERVRK